jgi:hypothetical protein
MPVKGVQALVDFLHNFETQHWFIKENKPCTK